MEGMGLGSGGEGNRVEQGDREEEGDWEPERQWT